jgi:hypothetical protein
MAVHPAIREVRPLQPLISLPLGQRLEKTAPRQDADHLAVVHHREILLVPGEELIHCDAQGVVPQEGPKAGLHGGPDRHTLHQGAHLRSVRFPLGPQVNEQRDEHQEPVEEEPQDRKADRHDLAGRGGDLGCPHVVQPAGQEGAKDPAAIHGKRRKQIEYAEGDVHVHQLDQKVPADQIYLRERGEARQGLDDDEEDDGYAQVHHRSSEGDPELLPRIFGHLLQAGDSADGEKRDIPRPHAIAPRRERVSELV